MYLLSGSSYCTEWILISLFKFLELDICQKLLGFRKQMKKSLGAKPRSCILPVLREGNSLQKHRACIHSTLKEGGEQEEV